MNKEFIYFKDKAMVVDENGEIYKEVDYYDDLASTLKIENQINEVEEKLFQDKLELKENDKVKYIKPKEYILSIQLVTILSTTLFIILSNNSLFDILNSTINTRFGSMNTYLYLNLLMELSCSLPISLATSIMSKLNIKNQKIKHDILTKEIEDKKSLIKDLYDAIKEIENTKKNTNLIYKEFDIIDVETNSKINPKVRTLKRR